GYPGRLLLVISGRPIGFIEYDNPVFYDHHDYAGRGVLRYGFRSDGIDLIQIRRVNTHFFRDAVGQADLCRGGTWTAHRTDFAFRHAYRYSSAENKLGGITGIGRGISGAPDRGNR